MKKLMVLLAAVTTAVCVQAASATWTVSNIYSVEDSTAKAGAGAYTAFLINSTTLKSSDLATFLADTSKSTADKFAKISNSALASSPTTAAGKVSTTVDFGALADGSYSMYNVIVDGTTAANSKNFIISSAVGADVTSVGDSMIESFSAKVVTQTSPAWSSFTAAAPEPTSGMLLLLGIKENKGWLTVGKGISGVFTDDMANEYLDDYLWPEFDRGNYEAAVECLLDELFAWYAGFYHVTGDASDDGGAIPELVLDAYEQDRRSRQMERTMDNLSAIFRIIVIALIIIFYISRNDRRRHNAYYRSMHVTPPPYFFWYMFNRARPYRNWVDPGFRNDRNDRDHRPPGGGGFGGGHGGGFGGFGGGGHGGGFGGGGGGFGGGGGGRR